METFKNGCEALLTAGSIDKGCIRIGIYERADCLCPRRIGWVLIGGDQARCFMGELESRLDELDTGREARSK